MSDKLPLFPLEMVLLPGTEVVLRLFEPRYKNMLKDCQQSGTPFGIVYCHDMKNEIKSMEDIGCLANIVEHTTYEDGTYTVRVEGGERFKVNNVTQAEQGYWQCDYAPLPEDVDMALDDPVFDSVLHLLDIYLDLLAEVDPEMVEDIPEDLSGSDLTFITFDFMAIPDDLRQKALAISSKKERATMCLTVLRQEIERLRFLLSETGEFEGEDEDYIPQRLN